MTSSTTRQRIIDSPLGSVVLWADEEALCGLYLEGQRAQLQAFPTSPSHRVLDAATAQLDAYFAGRLEAFDLPLAPRGTPFQRRVWTALRDIPFGQSICYAELARRVGSPSAVRAVGAANGRNPLSIVVPCHRVIGKDGSLTGYAGGVEKKRWLLEHEGWSLRDAG